MEKPTYTPVQQTVERSGTLFVSLQDLDATKPAGSMKIRVETITHYLGGHAKGIIARKRVGLGHHTSPEQLLQPPGQLLELAAPVGHLLDPVPLVRHRLDVIGMVVLQHPEDVVQRIVEP